MYSFKFYKMIRGLYKKLNIITPEKECEILNILDTKNWDNTLKRRVQQYGHYYVYKNEVNEVEKCPDWMIDILMIIKQELPVPEFDLDKLQIIVNEYNPGQGISPHIDDPFKFGNWVVTLSLGSDYVMRFKEKNSEKVEDILLEKCSAYLMTDDARYKWTHEIPARKTDTINGKRVKRNRRISITFRSIK